MRDRIEEEDEYIAEVAGSVAFGTTTFSVNPGQVGTFPWLSKIAAQYEKYEFEVLEFYYRPEVSQFATNGTTGKIILSLDYDAADAPPGTKQQCLDTDPHVDGMPYEAGGPGFDPKVHKTDMTLQVDCKPRVARGPLFVRPGGLPGGSDIKSYDLGLLAVSTIANQNTSAIGELRVRYRVRFMVPVLENLAAAPMNYQVSVFQSAAASEAGGATGVLTVVKLATPQVNALGAVNTVGSIVLPAGNYIVDVEVVFTNSTTAYSALQTQLFVNGAVRTQDANPSQTMLVAAGVLNATQCASYFVACTGTTSIAVLASATYGAGASTVQGSMRIVSV